MGEFAARRAARARRPVSLNLDELLALETALLGGQRSLDRDGRRALASAERRIAQLRARRQDAVERAARR